MQMRGVDSTREDPIHVIFKFDPPLELDTKIAIALDHFVGFFPPFWGKFS